MSRPIIEWCYHRANCTTCSKAAAFLEQHQIVPHETLNARKVSIGPDAAFEMLRQADRLFAVRGAKIYEFDLKAANDDESIASLIIGRSGSLRAPTLRCGTQVVVGFLPELYARILGLS